MSEGSVVTDLLVSYLRPHWRVLLGIAVLLLVQAIGGLILPSLMADIINKETERVVLILVGIALLNKIGDAFKTAANALQQGGAQHEAPSSVVTTLLTGEVIIT